MNNSVQAISQIEEQVKQLETELQHNIATLKESTLNKFKEEKELSQKRLAAHKAEVNDSVKEDLFTYRSQVETEEQAELQQLDALLLAKQDELVNTVLKEVYRRYGSF